MNYKYFIPTPRTKEEAQKQYRTLALQHHPNRGGDTRTMQDVNEEYKNILLNFTRNEQTARDDKARAEGRRAQGDVFNMEGIYKDLAEKIMAVLNIPNVAVELCGLWIWVTGDTKPAKETLKGLGFRWSAPKTAWYYPGIPSSGRGKHSLDAIRNMYGSRTFEKDEEVKAERIPA